MEDRGWMLSNVHGMGWIWMDGKEEEEEAVATNGLVACLFSQAPDEWAEKGRRC